MGTLNEDVRDELIEQDVQNQRASGGLQNEVDRRLQQLTRELRRVVAEVDPGSGTPAVKRRKLKRVEELARPVIGEAFRDINAMTRNTLGRMAVTDVSAVEIAIERAFDKVPDG